MLPIRIILLINLGIFYSSFTYSSPLLIAHANYPDQTQYLNKIQAAYREIGVESQLVQMPITRRLIALNSNKVDAVAASLPLYNEQFPNNIQVGPPISYAVMTLVCRIEKQCSTKVFNDKKEVIYANEVSHFLLMNDVDQQLNAKVVVVDDTVKLKAMFERARMDFFVVALEHPDIVDDFKASHGAVPIKTYPLYHFIHRQHVELKGPLSEALLKRFSIR